VNRRMPINKGRHLKLILPLGLSLCYAALGHAQSARSPSGGDDVPSAGTPQREQAAEGDDGPADLSGADLLRSVVAQLPREPLTITGSLTVRERKGVVVGDFGFTIQSDWGGNPARVSYTLRDRFGSLLEQLTVLRSGESPPQFEYAAGDPLTPADVPDLSLPVQGSDVSWLDLTLAFLWWRDADIVGEEEIRGRPCYIVEACRPAGQQAKGEDYVRVRLGIDKTIRMLLRAEGFDARGAAVRTIWVKSFRRIDERWMIKDMEIQGPSSSRRTRLRIHEAVAVESL